MGETPLSQAARLAESAVEAQLAGRHDRARADYQRAAELLLKAAEQSRGELRQRRARLAEALAERARALPAQAQPTPPSTGAAQRGDRPEAAEEGGAPAWLAAEKPAERFDDVAGLDEVKEHIRLKLIYPFSHPDEARRYGIRSGGGILLYGPPGTGKTLIARAIAGEVDAVFYAVKPSEVMSKWVGEAEQNVARLFAEARRHARAVIFVDEVESLVPRRRDSGSTVMQRVVPQILQELQGFERHRGALLFAGATNEPWALDPAVLRPGRFDERVYVPLPGFAARRKLLELALRGRPLAEGVSPDDLAARMDGYSGADIVNVCAKACAIPFVEAVRSGRERDVALADFDTVLAKLKPSVSRRDLARFERFAEGLT